MKGLTRRAALMAGSAALLAAGAARAAGEVERMREPAKAVVASGELPGVVTLAWRKGELVDVFATGLRDRERALPMERSTLFRLASMSKPVTAATALSLVDDGVMRLDDPITRWAPEFADMKVLRRPNGPLDDVVPAARPITVADLLTHRSGLTYGFTGGGPLNGALMQKVGMGIESPMTPDAWLAALAALPLAYQPGERFNYGHSTDVLGFVAGRAAKSSLREAMRERILDPLGMADTDFWVPPAKRERDCAIYFSPGPGTFVPITMGGFVGDAPPAYTSGGQGLVSTADDYLAFARMLMDGGKAPRGRRLLKADTVRRMLTDQLTPAQRALPSGLPGVDWTSLAMGYGVAVTRTAGPGGGAGAFTWPGAFGGSWQADPAEQTILIWLQQVLPAPPRPGQIPTGLPGQRASRQFTLAAYETLRS